MFQEPVSLQIAPIFGLSEDCMRIKTTVLRKIIKVDFPPGIDYNKLADKVGVQPMVAYGWLQTGKVHERYVPLIKSVPIETVRK